MVSFDRWGYCPMPSCSGPSAWFLQPRPTAWGTYELNYAAIHHQAVGLGYKNRADGPEQPKQTPRR